jgi:hypothetical protein
MTKHALSARTGARSAILRARLSAILVVGPPLMSGVVLIATFFLARRRSASVEALICSALMTWATAGILQILVMSPKWSSHSWGPAYSGTFLSAWGGVDMQCATPPPISVATRNAQLPHYFLAICIMAIFASRSPAADSVATENTKTGTLEWQIGVPSGSGAPEAATPSATPGALVALPDCSQSPCWSQAAIEGYASATSVNQGASIDLFVKSSQSYSIRIFRVGWYNGLGARELTSAGTTSLPVIRSANAQPADPYCASSDSYLKYGLIECAWTNPFTLTIPTDWVSGVYLAKLTTMGDSLQRYIIFVVRDDARSSPYLFQTSVTTYQAYNQWGGTSLYTNFSSTAVMQAPTPGPGAPPDGECTDCPRSNGVKASFNRPYEGDYGAGGFFDFEINMVRFLEREGYDVTYVSNIDTHANPNLLLTHKAFFSVGHDEYWSWEMRRNVEDARDRGVSLGLFSANSAFWRIRLEPRTRSAPAEVPAQQPQTDRTIVAFRGSVETPWNHWVDGLSKDGDPTNDNRVTTLWRPAVLPPGHVPEVIREPLPEQALLGVQFEPYFPRDCLVGNITISNTANWPAPLDESGRSWLLHDTALFDNDVLTGILGYETDQIDDINYPGSWAAPTAPAGRIRLADSLFPNPAWALSTPVAANMSYYLASSGAHIFATGTIFWSWGLDAFHSDSGYGGAAAIPEKCDTVAPGAWESNKPRVSVPAQQMMRNFLNKIAVNKAPVARPGGPYRFESGKPTVFDASASTDYDGNIASYSWNFGDNSPVVSGRQVIHTYTGPGPYGVQLTVTDNQGATNQAGSVVVSAPPFTVSPVAWTNTVHSVGSGSTLTSIDTGQDWGSAASSQRQIVSGDGYLEFVATGASKSRMCGLAPQAIAGYQSLTYAVFLRNDSRVQIYESGVRRDQLDLSYRSGDVFRIEIAANQVVYRQNGVPIFTTQGTPSYPLVAGASLYHYGAAISNAVMAGTLSAAAPVTGRRDLSDLNNDGKSDLIWQYQNGLVATWLMNGAAWVGLSNFEAPLDGWVVRGAGDFNGDGQTDLVLQQQDGSVAIWLMNGTVVVSTQYIYNQPLPGLTVRAVADLNADGWPDILWQTSDGSVWTWLMNGTSWVGQAIYASPLPGWTIRGTGDFNGDGKPDILWQYQDGSIWTWIMNGLAWSGQAIYNQPLALTVRGAGDFWGDGTTNNILFQYPNGSVAVWRGGTPAGGQYIYDQPLPGWTVAATK